MRNEQEEMPEGVHMGHPQAELLNAVEDEDDE